MDSIRLTLPSNASLDVHRANRPYNYTIHLKKMVRLEGDWEVALLDIQYPYPTDMTNVYPSLFVYSDVVKHQMVGDTETPLLGVIPVTGKPGEQCYWRFNPPVYLDVEMPTFQDINIRLATDTGQNFPITGDGRVICQLHLRRKGFSI